VELVWEAELAPVWEAELAPVWEAELALALALVVALRRPPAQMAFTAR
jgi:hypothetical protein